MSEIIKERLPCGCPSHYPDWQDGDVDLGGSLAHRLSIPMLMHMPMGYETYLLKQKEDIERLGLHESWPGFNFTRTAIFRGEIICPLEEKHSPARNLITLANPFMLRIKLFHGDVTEIKHEVRTIQSALLDEGRMPKELYLSYLTCPVCEEEQGGKRIMLARRWVKNKKLEGRLGKKS